MKTIQLNRMELRNFKGVVQADYDFAETTKITGANGTGKSTIYEAYLWTLFDKNAQGNTTKVQPLDENNQIKHKLTTSVRVYLTINGNKMIVERTLKEDWVKARGTAELVLKGTTSEYAINEVPMSKTAYNAKLAEIMPLDRWFNISCVGIIPNMEQKACRAALQAIAPAIDERTLAEPYPEVLDALTKGLNLDELSAMTKQTKSKAKAELDGIPAALDAQDRLRVEENFDELEVQLKTVNADIENVEGEIDSMQKGMVDDAAIAKANEQRDELKRMNVRIMEIEGKATRDYNENRGKLDVELRLIATETAAVEQKIELGKKMADTMMADIERYKKQIAEYREQWKSKNAEAYVEPDINGICPTCGQAMPESLIVETKEKAREEWNSRKTAALLQIQKDAEAVKARIDKIVKDNETQQDKAREDNARLYELSSKSREVEQKRDALPTVDDILAADENYKNALSEKQVLESKLKVDAEKQKDTDAEAKIAEMKEKLASIKESRDNILKRLAGRDTNIKIEIEHKRLEEMQRSLADTIAQAEGIEAQIAGFRKAKITAVENGVSSLFSMVRWKMYEPNVTNDGEKEICQAIIDGVPYEQQNTATRINAGIDIVNAFATAYGVSAPLFIDNAESVTNIIPTIGQSIRMTVVAGAQLKINL